MADYYYEPLLNRLLAHEHVLAQCQNPECDAIFVAPSNGSEPAHATCPYCEHELRAINNRDDLPDDVDVPAQIVPPSFDEAGALERLSDRLSSLPYLPAHLKSATWDIDLVYLVQSRQDYACFARTAGWRKDTVYANGTTRTHYTARYYRTSGAVTHLRATHVTKMNDKTFSLINPFNVDKHRTDTTEEAVRDAVVELPRRTLDDCRLETEALAKQQFLSAAHKGYYTEIVEEESRVFNTLNTFVLLPIWRFTERDGDGRYLMNAQSAALVGKVSVDDKTRKATNVRHGVIGILICVAAGVLLWFIGGGPEYMATHEGSDPMSIAACVPILGLIALGVLLFIQDSRRMSQMEELETQQFSEQKHVDVREDVCKQSRTSHNIMTDAHKEAREFWKSDTPL